MDLSAEFVTLNLAYVVYVAATIPKKIIPLRVVLIAASIAFVVYGLVAEIYSVVVWNLLFGVPQLYRLVVALRERRRFHLDDVGERVRATLFPTVAPFDFAFLWGLGEERKVVDEVLIREDVENDRLVLVIGGDLVVERNGAVIARRSVMNFVGEQSLLTGEVASATVRTEGPCVVRVWPHEKLLALEQLRPELYTRMVAALSRELSEKVNNSVT